MLFQMLSMSSDRNDTALAGVPADPRNPQAVTILFFSVAPLALAVLQAEAWADRALLLVALGCFAGGLWLITLGIARGDAFAKAEQARAPKWKLRLIGSALIGIGITGLIIARFQDPAEAAFYGFIGAGLSLLAFGSDPMRDKNLATPQDRARHKVDRAADRIAPRLDAMSTLVATLDDAELAGQVEGFSQAVRRMLDYLHDDPERLRAARSHLGVYLTGAEEATSRFVMLYRATKNVQARADYMMLLCDLIEEFHAQTEQTATAGKTQLDVQIAVLRDKMSLRKRPSA